MVYEIIPTELVSLVKPPINPKQPGLFFIAQVQQLPTTRTTANNQQQTTNNNQPTTYNQPPTTN